MLPPLPRELSVLTMDLCLGKVAFKGNQPSLLLAHWAGSQDSHDPV